MPLTRPSLSSRTCEATDWYITATRPVRTAPASVTLGSYLAWIGQTGTRLGVPAQTRRSWSACHMRARGVRATAVPRRAAVDPFVGARKGERPVLNQIALLGIAEIAESSLRSQAENRRTAGIHGGRIGQIIFCVEQFRRIRAFRHFRLRLEEAIHVAVDVRRQCLAGLENENFSAAGRQHLGDQRSCNAGADDYPIGVPNSLSPHVGTPYAM